MATTATTSNPYELPINPAARSNPGWWVMTLVIVTEGMLFAYLLFGYFYLGSMTPGAFPTDGPPELKLVIPNTIVLLISSGTMYWAERGIRAGNQGRLRLGMLVTLVLGILFLIISANLRATVMSGLDALQQWIAVNSPLSYVGVGALILAAMMFGLHRASQPRI